VNALGYLDGWKEISQYLGISERHARRLVAQGLPAKRSKSRRRVRALETELRAWFERWVASE